MPILQGHSRLGLRLVVGVFEIRDTILPRHAASPARAEFKLA
jgi:hypothetical protein